MPFDDLEVLGALHVARGPGGFTVVVLRAAGDVAPVREGVPHAFDAGQEIEVPVALLMVEHEGGHARGIGPVGEYHHVKHQSQVGLVIFWDAGGRWRGLGKTLVEPRLRFLAGKLETFFHGADGLEIFVELVAIGHTHARAEAAGIGGDRV